MGFAQRDPVRLVGRDAELAVLGEFLAAAPAGRALILTGSPGIGKTSLWEAALEAARERGRRVLATRASEAEARLSFAGLIDLLDEVDAQELADLPAPQRRALEVAVLRAEPGPEALDPTAIGLGLLNALRMLASRGPLLIAIDDVPMLDAPSAEALGFAARRLRGGEVSFLLSRRAGSTAPLEGVLEPGVERLEVGRLSLGALRRLLSERVGLALSRHLLRRVDDLTQGNPLFALEVGRTLAEQGLPASGAELPVPDEVERLLDLRVAGLPRKVRSLLLAVALSGDLSASQLEAVVGAAADEGVERGVLAVNGGRVRASHPLLAAAAKKHSGPQERRALHAKLAAVVSDEGLRACHLALAADRPDEQLAVIAARAAAGAAARGARLEAVELGEHALRLTPSGSAGRTGRLLALAEYLAFAGESRRVTQLLKPELDALAPGETRARVYFLLCDGIVDDNQEIRTYLERARIDAGEESEVGTAALAELSSNSVIISVQGIVAAETQAAEALAASRPGGQVERLALHAAVWARSLRGLPIDELCRRFRDASDAAPSLAWSPERVAGQRYVWRGEVDRARDVLAGLLALADEQGEAYAYALQRLHLCELELRIGAWGAAAGLLEEWAQSGERMMWPMYERCLALLGAGRGRLDEVEEWSERALAAADRTGNRWDRLEALRARGMGALLAGNPEQATREVRPVWEHTQREGVDEPGVFPVAPDLVEALVELGDLDEARAVVDRLRGLAEAQNHPWGLVTSERCEALIRLAASRYHDQAAARLGGAAADYARLGLWFDRARTLLVLGRVQRRHRQWAAARRSLEQATAAFGQIGSSGWEERARSELERVGARRPAPPGALTPTEERVAALAAKGLSNKQIAAELFVTVSTVEKHLSHAYGKLGVRSRSQLAARVRASG